MKTLLELIQLSSDWLQKRGLATPRLEAEILIAAAIGIKRLDLYVQYDRPVNDTELQLIRSYLDRRGKREPFQYILAQVEFLDCIFNVSPDVLIPRPETEILADQIVKSITDPKGKVLWDICCGSGCLGISIKKKMPELEVVLSDISSAACRMAKENAILNNVDVEILEGDLTVPYGDRKAHYIVSNPPYITDNEYQSLAPEVKNYEPKRALVSGTTGLEIYSRLERELPSKLYSNASLWFELGPEATKDLFQSPSWANVRVQSDWSGLPRFLLLNFKEDFRILST